MKTGSPTAVEVERGQQISTPLVLRAYDLFVDRVGATNGAVGIDRE